MCSWGTVAQCYATLLDQGAHYLYCFYLPLSCPSGLYPSLAKAGISLVSELEDLVPLFQSLASAWPLLPIHFFKLVAVVKSTKLIELVTSIGEDSSTANQELVVMVTRMLQIEHLVSVCSYCSSVYCNELHVDFML